MTQNIPSLIAAISRWSLFYCLFAAARDFLGWRLEKHRSRQPVSCLNAQSTQLPAQSLLDVIVINYYRLFLGPRFTRSRGLGYKRRTAGAPFSFARVFMFLFLRLHSPAACCHEIFHCTMGKFFFQPIWMACMLAVKNEKLIRRSSVASTHPTF